MQSIFLPDYSRSSEDNCDQKAAARTIKEPSKCTHALIRCSARSEQAASLQLIDEPSVIDEASA
jgi:hypothetical protein